MNLTQTNSFRLSSTFLSCQLEDHKGIEIKYLCCSEECMQPLCPECIQHHSEYHERKNRVASLKNFSEVFAANQQKITKQISEIESDLQIFDKFLKLDPTKETNIFNRLQEFKKQLFKNLNDVFTELEHDFAARMNEHYNIKAEKVSRISREVQIYLEQLRKYEADLASENYLKVITKMYRCNLSKEYDEIRSKLAKTDLVLDSYELDVDDGLIDRVRDDLAQHIELFKSGEVRPSTAKEMIVESKIMSHPPPTRMIHTSPGKKLESNVQSFEIVESDTVPKKEESVEKLDHHGLEGPSPIIVSQQSMASQSSNYIEYGYSPEFAIKDFFPGEGSKDVSPMPVTNETSQQEVQKELKIEIEDTKSQKSLVSDEYQSDFEESNDGELEIEEEQI